MSNKVTTICGQTMDAECYVALVDAQQQAQRDYQNSPAGILESEQRQKARNQNRTLFISVGALIGGALGLGISQLFGSGVGGSIALTTLGLGIGGVIGDANSYSM